MIPPVRLKKENVQMKLIVQERSFWLITIPKKWLWIVRLEKSMGNVYCDDFLTIVRKQKSSYIIRLPVRSQHQKMQKLLCKKCINNIRLHSDDEILGTICLLIRWGRFMSEELDERMWLVPMQIETMQELLVFHWCEIMMCMNHHQKCCCLWKNYCYRWCYNTI